MNHRAITIRDPLPQKIESTRSHEETHASPTVFAPKAQPGAAQMLNAPLERSRESPSGAPPRPAPTSAPMSLTVTGRARSHAVRAGDRGLAALPARRLGKIDVVASFSRRAIVGLAALLAPTIATFALLAASSWTGAASSSAAQTPRSGVSTTAAAGGDAGGKTRPTDALGGTRPPDARPSDAPAASTTVGEGPGGRTALTDWTVSPDPGDLGVLLGWPTGDFAGTEVTVPNTVNPAPVKGRVAVPSYEGSVAWYRTTFTAPVTGMYALSFASVSYVAEAWLDGQPLGSHIGFDLPFELRSELSAGTHTLVVRVDWRDPLVQTHQGFYRTWFNFGGIDGLVTVRELGASELSNPTIQTTLTPDTPRAQTATVALSVDVRNDGPTRTIAPEGSLSRAGRTISFSFPAQLVAAEQTVRMSATVTVPEPALWAPGSPSLYDLTLAVAGESSYTANVGLRQLTWSGERMYLNGQPLRLHGASIQMEAPGRGEALGPAEEAALVQELQAIGANATRCQHPLPASMLERLDAAGIMVWQGIGPNDPSGDWTGITPTLAERAQEDVRTAAMTEQLHPSVIAWNLTNELAGNGHPGGQAQYVEQAAQWLHSYDPGRVVAVDVWGLHPPKIAGALYRYVDAVSETDYSGWYQGVHYTAKRIRAFIHERLAAMHRTFAGKIQLISEFGAEANTLNKPSRPGGYAFQSHLLAQHISIYEADLQLSGMLIWVLRDFAENPTYNGGSVRAELPHVKLIEGINGKGLFDYAGQPKPAASVVARLFKALPAV
jgi:Glycosyl hydrolases family 2, TIM barrel domain/Glycosyl hydrolases family 2